MDSVHNPLTGLGTSGDKGAVGRPNPWVQPLDDEELRALYTYNGVGRRIVSTFPMRATRKGWEVQGLDPAADKALMTRERIREAMEMGDLFGGSAALLVTEEKGVEYSDLSWMAEPLRLENVIKLHAVQVFDTFEAHPLEFEDDLREVNYRGPRTWSLGAHGAYTTVHSSRVLHFRGRRRLPSERWSQASFGGGFGTWNRQQDISVLQAVWDEIRRLTETMQGGAALAQELQQTVWRLDGFGNTQVGDDATGLLTRLTLMQKVRGIVNAIVMDTKDEFAHHASAPQGFRDLSDAAKAMLSAVTGIPEVILFGATPTGLNTDGDSAWEGFRQLISDYQETHQPQLERLYQVLFAARDGESTGDPNDVQLTFKALDEPNELQQAQTRLITAQTDSIYVQSGVISPDEIRDQRFGEKGWKLDLEELKPIDDGLWGGLGSFADLMSATPLGPQPIGHEAPAPAPTPTPAPEEGAMGPVPGAPTEDVQKTALNGAQVAALQQIVTSAAKKQIPRESAVAMIEASFPLTKAQAEEVMGEVGATFFAEEPPDPGPADDPPAPEP